jgi:hypothetical protein
LRPTPRPLETRMHRLTRRQLSPRRPPLAFGLAGRAPALAQSRPPLRVIMPFSAGSGVDTIIRAAQNGWPRRCGRRS